MTDFDGKSKSASCHSQSQSQRQTQTKTQSPSEGEGEGYSVRQLKSKKPRFYLGSRGPNVERAKETATGKDSSKVKTRASGLGH